MLWNYTMSLDEQEMADALHYQLKLWTALAQYLQGTWRGLAHAFEELRVDPAFIRELGLGPFLPIYPGIASPVQPSFANPHAA